ncbi:uncharacterized protein OCT59_013366 [Rhizophagus irregularis]|nr:hypothetical protein OCT59_013366 [Rhizophagus irregularis]GET53616.1 hypothetical protein GLOIN_2v1769667 [Rhizophagus irregularis DAOM 181602=DAOM 197198]
MHNIVRINYSVVCEKWMHDIRYGPNNEVIDEVVEEELAFSSSHVTPPKKKIRIKKKKGNKMVQSTSTDKETLDSTEEPMRIDDEISEINRLSNYTIGCTNAYTADSAFGTKFNRSKIFEKNN